MLNFTNCTNSLRAKDEITITLTSQNIHEVIQAIKKHNRLYLKNLKVEVGDSTDNLQELINVCAAKKIGQIEFSKEVKNIEPAAILIKNGNDYTDQPTLDNQCIQQMQKPGHVESKAVERKEEALVEIVAIKNRYQPKLRIAKSKQLSRSRQKSKSRSSSRVLTEQPHSFTRFVDRYSNKIPMLSHRHYEAYSSQRNKNTYYTASALNQLLRYNLLNDFDLFNPPAGFSAKFNDHQKIWVIDYDSQVKNRSEYQIKINPEYNRPYLNDDQVARLLSTLPEDSIIKANYTNYNRGKKLLLRKYLPEIISLPPSAITYLERDVLNQDTINELVLQYYLDEKNHQVIQEQAFNNKLKYISLTAEDKQSYEACEILNNMNQAHIDITSAFNDMNQAHIDITSAFNELRISQASDLALTLYNNFKAKFTQYKRNLDDISSVGNLKQIRLNLKLKHLKALKKDFSKDSSQKNWPYYFTYLGVFLDIENYEQYKDATTPNHEFLVSKLEDRIDQITNELNENLYSEEQLDDEIASLRPNTNLDFNEFVNAVVEAKDENQPQYAIDILLSNEETNHVKHLSAKINSFNRPKLYKKHLLRLYLSKSPQFLQYLAAERNTVLIKALLQSDINYSQYQSCTSTINNWNESSQQVFYKLLEKHLEHHDETNLQEMVEFFNKFKTKYSFIDSFNMSDPNATQALNALEAKEEQATTLALDNVESLPCALSEMNYFLQKVPAHQRKSQLDEFLTNPAWQFSSNNNRRESIITHRLERTYNQFKHFYVHNTESKHLLDRVATSSKERLINLRKIKSILKECKSDLDKPYIDNLIRSIATEDAKNYIRGDGFYDEKAYEADVDALKTILKNPHEQLPPFAKAFMPKDLFYKVVNDQLLFAGASKCLAVHDLKVYVETILRSSSNPKEFMQYGTRLVQLYNDGYYHNIYLAFPACANAPINSGYNFEEFLNVLESIDSIGCDIENKKQIMKLVGVFKLRLSELNQIKDKLSELSWQDLNHLTLVEDLNFEDLKHILNFEVDTKEDILDRVVRGTKVRQYIKLGTTLQNKITELFNHDNDLQASVSTLLKGYMKSYRQGCFNKLKKIYERLQSPKDSNLKLILDLIDQTDATILETLINYNDIEFFKNYRQKPQKIDKNMLDVLVSLDAKDEKAENATPKVEFAAVRDLSHKLIYKYVEFNQTDFSRVKPLVDSLRTEPYSKLSASSQEEIYSLYIKQINECSNIDNLTNLTYRFNKLKNFIIPYNPQQNLDVKSTAPHEAALPNTNMESDITLHSSLFIGDRKIGDATLDINFLNTIVNKIEQKISDDQPLKYKIFHVICKLIVNDLYNEDEIDAFIDKASTDAELFDLCYTSPPYPSMDAFKAMNQSQYETFEKDPYGESYRENQKDTDDEKLSNGFYTDHPNAIAKLETENIINLNVAIQAADNQNIAELQASLKTGSNFNKVASAARLLYISKGYRLNTTQYVAVYNSLKYKNTYTKIATGEGKSRINMLLNAILSISSDEKQEAGEVNQQNQGVFITSNANLAKRDFVDYQSFFEICGVSSILLTENSNYDLDAFSKAQLIFTDESSWGLFLSEMYARYTKSEVDAVLSAKNLIVDEADTLFYQSNPYNISQQTESLKSIAKLYEPICQFIDADNVDEKTLLISFRAQNEELLSSCSISDQKLLGLINAAKTAKKLEYGKHFAIDDDGRVVVITDGQRAGLDSTYTGGVHQFLIKRLQLRKKELLDNSNSRHHGNHHTIDRKLETESSSLNLDNSLRKLDGDIEFTPESLVRYSLKGHELLQTAKSIKAVTGSLGNQSLRYGLRNFYSQDQLHVAELDPHRTSQRTMPSSVPLFQDQQTLIAKIKEKVTTEYKDIPVLIVTENDDSVCKAIASKIPHSSCINSETTNYDYIISQAGTNGSVTVAVAGRAGRGTDIKTNNSEGLAVILTFIPTDREYQQIIGRCARQGQKGRVDILLYDKAYQPGTEIKIANFEEKTQVKSSSNSRSLWINNIKDRYINENFRQPFQTYLDDHRAEESSLQTAYANFREKVETEWLTKVPEIVSSCNTFDTELINVNINLEEFSKKVIEYWGEFNQESDANIVHGDGALNVPEWAKVILIQQNDYIAKLISSNDDLSTVDLRSLASKAVNNAVNEKFNNIKPKIEKLNTETKINDSLITKLNNLEKEIKTLNDNTEDLDSDMKTRIENKAKEYITQIQSAKSTAEQALALALENQCSGNIDIGEQFKHLSRASEIIQNNTSRLLSNALSSFYNKLLNKHKKTVVSDAKDHRKKEARDLFLLLGCFALCLTSLLVINILSIELSLMFSLGILALFGTLMLVIYKDFRFHKEHFDQDFNQHQQVKTNAAEINNILKSYTPPPEEHSRARTGPGTGPQEPEHSIDPNRSSNIDLN